MHNSAFDRNTFWLLWGFAGQLLFSARFIIQWVVSEYRRMSVIPHLFWYFSLGGGLVLFAYALHKQDPVFILGQGLGLVVYLRNIFLIRRQAAAVTA